jgi:sulfatase maturation enzyme AslB (radical SAM superfamily)
LWDVPFVQGWEQVKQRSAAIRLPAPCAVCEAKDVCRACAAMVITESGNFDTVPAYRCQMMGAYREQWNRVKEEML